MSIAAPRRALTIALIGNPNTGKSTIFSALAGVRQRVGNYPGVTVEKKLGRLRVGEYDCTLVDLPGTYSLAPRSPDEMIAVDVLLGRRHDVKSPDLVLCIVDASNLERNLYLVSQVLEMELPVLVVLNMTDVAEQKGIRIDFARLEQQLGVPIVATQGHKRRGIEDLKRRITEVAGGPPAPRISPFSAEFQAEVVSLQQSLANGEGPPPRYLCERMLLDTNGYLMRDGLSGINGKVIEEVEAARKRLAEAGQAVPAVEAIARYRWAGEVVSGALERPAQCAPTWSDRVDKVLTHKVAGLAIFAFLMLLMFEAVFLLADSLFMGPLEDAFSWLGESVAAGLEPGALQSLLVDGVIAGVGGVLVFLPQIFILFFFIAVLEDCGYMARAAYLMDRLMSGLGLSGKSFIPLLSSFACAIPGIMAARVIEDRRDRLVTILVAPLMSCSARMPVYLLLIGAFIPPVGLMGGWLGLKGLTMFAMYVTGIVAAVVVALLLKRTILKGPTPVFVMELPDYKWPSPGVVLHRMFERGWAFIRRAGTLIFAVSVIVWAAAYYPRDPEKVEGPYAERLATLEAEQANLAKISGELTTAQETRLAEIEAELSQIEHEIAGDYLRQSFLGRAGHWIEPAVRPLGWDWRIGCAVIASFPAREVVIGTLGVIYNLGADTDEESEPLREKLKFATWDGTERSVFNVPVALSLMVFFALCAQCAATLAVIRRETNTWRWPAFTFAYMTGLAYLGALVTYHVGTWIGG